VTLTLIPSLIYLLNQALSVVPGIFDHFPGQFSFAVASSFFTVASVSWAIVGTSMLM